MPKQDQRTGKMQKLAHALEGGRKDNRSPWMTPGTPDKSSTGFEERTWFGVPMERANDTFETFDLSRNPEMSAAHARCVAVASGHEWSAFMLGSTGNGKTHLAIAAMHLWADAHEYGRGVDFWKVPDLLAFLRSKLNEGIRAEVGEAQVEVDKLAPIIAEVDQFKNKKAKLENKVDIISQLKANQQGPVQLMDEISRALPALLWMDRMSVAGQTITLSGRAFNTNAVANFLENLDRVQEFQEPVLQDTSQTGQTYSFVIRFDFSHVQDAEGPDRAPSAG